MIGDQIKKFRTQNGMTQQNLADKLFVTAQAVSRWENGEVEPSISTIAKMAEIFGVSTDEMLGISTTTGQETPKPQEQPPANAEPVKEDLPPLLGNCETCKRPIYKKEELIIKHYGRTSPQHIYCIQCEKKAQEQHLQGLRSLAVSRRKRSFIFGGLGAAVVLAIMIAVCITTQNPALIAAAVAGPITTYTLISCLILNNNFIEDMILGIASRSIHMPGIIFSLSLDGIVWFLTVKLGLLLLSFAISVALFLLAVALGLVLSVFVYPFALAKNINHPEKQD